jgi:hypothetical protein
LSDGRGESGPSGISLMLGSRSVIGSSIAVSSEVTSLISWLPSRA